MTREYDIAAIVGADGPISADELEHRRLLDLCAKLESENAALVKCSNAALRSAQAEWDFSKAMSDRRNSAVEEAEHWHRRWSTLRRWFIATWLAAALEAAWIFWKLLMS